MNTIQESLERLPGGKEWTPHWSTDEDINLADGMVSALSTQNATLNMDWTSRGTVDSFAGDVVYQILRHLSFLQRTRRHPQPKRKRRDILRRLSLLRTAYSSLQEERGGFDVFRKDAAAVMMEEKKKKKAAGERARGARSSPSSSMSSFLPTIPKPQSPSKDWE
jgi:hypothetical protein